MASPAALEIEVEGGLLTPSVVRGVGVVVSGKLKPFRLIRAYVNAVQNWPLNCSSM